MVCPVAFAWQNCRCWLGWRHQAAASGDQVGFGCCAGVGSPPPCNAKPSLLCDWRNTKKKCTGLFHIMTVPNPTQYTKVCEPVFLFCMLGFVLHTSVGASSSVAYAPCAGSPTSPQAGGPGRGGGNRLEWGHFKKLYKVPTTGG